MATQTAGAGIPYTVEHTAEATGRIDSVSGNNTRGRLCRRERTIAVRRRLEPSGQFDSRGIRLQADLDRWRDAFRDRVVVLHPL